MGCKVNLWKAVKVTKNLNSETIPTNLTLVGVPVAEGCADESLGNFFSEKIKSNVSRTVINRNNVYNGKCILLVQNRNFMTKNDVELYMADLNGKRSEGFD